VPHGNRLLIPVAGSVSVRFPGRWGGLVWNRPLGIVREEGKERAFVLIPDRTRQVQWLLLGTGVAVGILFRFVSRRRSRKRSRHRFLWR